MSIDSAVLLTAKDLNINLSEAVEIGIVQAVSKLKVPQWKIENQTAIQSSNDFVEGRELPLYSDRLFRW
ncbi:type II toxin-antitoxin system CcdA family antitoxin [Lentilitoribacter sp. Alg239-R112]|uniref:type II toxin-antitoxin system CcdA family antitoxin n=1 Tax=Lentilitoribacter sp. Alg239-R112 TaxID=2305987 RepID=UPI0018D98EEA|nr:type II toxin-antitoxin system CcdA family antitoxin [Lentilitoribacter sp. Alg239-R112]